MTNEILKMTNIVKRYTMGDGDLTVLDHVNFTVHDGEFVSILGPSGSGKSTMMNIIGCLDVPNEGEYILAGHDVKSLDESELAKIRNRQIGFVFQSFQLLQRLTALENVMLPLIYKGIPAKQREEKAIAMLEKVGLSDKLYNRPNQLSGGQQQRVAIARAMVTEPSILLADEPTGALDQKTGVQILALFKEINAEGKTIIMITHDMKIASNGSRIVNILDGRMSESSESEAANAN